MFTKNYYTYENICATNTIYWTGGPSYTTQYEDLGITGSDGNPLLLSFKTTDSDYYDDLINNYKLSDRLTVNAGIGVESLITDELGAYNIIELPNVTYGETSINFGIDNDGRRKIVITGTVTNGNDEAIELTVFGIWKTTTALNNGGNWVYPKFLIAVASPDEPIIINPSTTYNFVLEITEG